MSGLDEFAGQFSEEPGYFDFARVGPLGAAVLAEMNGQAETLSRARFGGLDNFAAQDGRVRDAVSALTGFPADQVVFQPNTSMGLMHAMFGVTGGVLMSEAEFPSLPYAAVRAAQSLGVVTPQWLETDHGRVTPGQVREQISQSTVAVAVSLVDFRTGYIADLEGIRQVIGDRLLIVDAIQGFTVVDAAYEFADVIVSGGQKWVRAGWGTGFMALSETALERITPVISGFNATDLDEPWSNPEVQLPTAGAAAFSVSMPDRIAQARLAAALEQVEAVSVPVIARSIAEKTDRLIDTADEYGLQVTSPRDVAERAGIVVVTPRPDCVSLLTASLFNHGVSATSREGSVRFSAHVSTGDESFEALARAFSEFGMLAAAR